MSGKHCDGIEDIRKKLSELTTQFTDMKLIYETVELGFNETLDQYMKQIQTIYDALEEYSKRLFELLESNETKNQS